jgi:hypothetical protein
MDGRAGDEHRDMIVVKIKVKAKRILDNPMAIL